MGSVSDFGKSSAASIVYVLKNPLTVSKGIAVYIGDIIKNPKETWHHIKVEAKHYWVGSKLLWSEIKMTSEILGRLIRGFGVTRRER